MIDLLELREVSVCYGERVALDRVTLAIPKGAQVAVVGPNGAGKSTLFRAVMGLVSLRAGEILLDGRPPVDTEPVARRRTVFDVVAMGCYGRRRWLKRLSAADRELVHESRLAGSSTAPAAHGRLSGERSSGCSWPGRWPSGPRCSCSMNRSPVWISLRESLCNSRVSRPRGPVLVSTHDLDLASDGSTR